MQPSTGAAPQGASQPIKPLRIKRFPRQRHFLAVFFISFMWGTFGVDRMYLGKVGTGILKLVTFGGFGFWVIIDLLLIMGGYMKDKQGRPLLQFTEYKKFAYMTVLLFALVLGAVILINGIALIVGVTQLIMSIQDGTLPNVPGLETLMPGTSGGEVNDLLQQY